MMRDDEMDDTRDKTDGGDVGCDDGGEKLRSYLSMVPCLPGTVVCCTYRSVCTTKRWCTTNAMEYL